MVFVLVNGVLYNTNSIRRITRGRQGNGDLVYAGRDKQALTSTEMEAFMLGLRGKKLVRTSDKDLFLAGNRVSAGDTELAEEETDESEPDSEPERTDHFY